MSNIIEAEYVSVWDDNYAVTSKCKIDLDTKKVYDIEEVNMGDGLDICTREYVRFDGEEHDVEMDDNGDYVMI